MKANVRSLAGAFLVSGLIAAGIAARLPRTRALVEGLVTRADILSGDHWMVFAASQVVVAACGILPASLMAVAAGAAYGMVAGLLISALGTMLGGWVAFLMSRSVLRPFILRLVDRFGLADLDEAISTRGWRFVCLLRISPIMPFAATSYGLGLTRVSQRAYLLGTVASLPALTSYVALGAFGRESVVLGRAQAGLVQWMLPALGVVSLFLAVALLRRSVSAARGPTATAERQLSVSDTR